MTHMMLKTRATVVEITASEGLFKVHRATAIGWRDLAIVMERSRSAAVTAS